MILAAPTNLPVTTVDVFKVDGFAIEMMTAAMDRMKPSVFPRNAIQLNSSSAQRSIVLHQSGVAMENKIAQMAPTKR
jgi:hypothetical protein